jgi:hypothetical protein
VLAVVEAGLTAAVLAAVLRLRPDLVRALPPPAPVPVPEPEPVAPGAAP